MPSIDAHRVSLWARVVAACAVVGAVTLSLLTFEAALFGVVAYGALVLFDAAVRAVALALGVAPADQVAPVGALLATLALFAVVGAVYRVAVERGDVANTGFRTLTGAYVALIGASIVLTDWAIRWLGLPRWVTAVVFVTLIALFYPMVLYKVATDDGTPTGDDQPDWQTDDAADDRPSWQTDDSSEDTGDETTAGDATADEAATESGWLSRTRRRLRENRRENVARWRARWAERWGLVVAITGYLRRAVTGPYRSRGPPGVAAVVLAAACLFGLPFALTDSREPLLAGLAAAVGCAVTAVHLGSELRAELAETVVLRELDDHVTDAPADDATAEGVRERVTRLAAGADLPAPTVRVVRSRAPIAAAVGYRPAASTVVVSTGLVEALDADERDAVLAHELAHVANRDAAVLTALSVPRVAARRAFERYGFNPVVALLAGVASLVGRFCTAVVARAREYAADDGAVAITGDPAALASALATLDETVARRPTADLRAAAAFSVVPPAWEQHRFFDRTRRLIYRGVLGTHPNTSDRIERLQARADRRERE